MKKVLDAIVVIVGNYMPSSYLFAIVLTVIVFISGLLFTDTSFLALVEITGDGMWDLLAFSMQIALTVFTSYTFSTAPVIKRFLKRLARLAKTRVQAVVLVTFVSLACTYINWALGLIAGAILAKEVAAINRGKKIPYALLCAGVQNCHRPVCGQAVLLPRVFRHGAGRHHGVQLCKGQP